jgi:PAS domain S-box-containing protein
MYDRYKLGLRGKTTLVLGSLIFLVLMVTSFVSYWQSKKVIESIVIDLEQSKFSVLKHEIEGTLSNHHKNLMSLLDVPPIQSILRARANKGIDPENGDSLLEWRQRLMTIFSSFLKNHAEYQQIRYIDVTGNELVRIQSDVHGKVSVISDEALQNKSDTSYVKKTLKLQPGEVYYSDVTLNRERGIIQVPHIPVLRLATPVYDANGQVAALLVINLSTQQLFAGVLSETNAVQRSIVDDKGYYIKHADNSKTFGLERGFEYTFLLNEPELAEISRHQDQFTRRDEEQNELDGFQKIYFAPQDKSRYWLLVLNIPEKVVFEKISTTQNKILIASLLIGTLALILIVWFFSRKILTPIVELATAAKQLKAGNLAIRVDANSARDEFKTIFNAINAFAKNQQQATILLENRVAAAKKRLSAVIDNVVDAIITIDHLGQIKSFNPAATNIFGYSDAEVIGQNVKMLMPEPYCSEHDAYLAHHMATGENKVIGIGREVLGRRKDGSIFPMELAVGEMKTNGRMMFTGIVRDVTERNTARKALHETSERLDLATTAGGIGVWEYDLLSGELKWDERMFQIYGVKKEDFSGAYEAWTNSLAPEELARSEAEIQAAISGEKEFQTEFTVIWPNGENRCVEAAAIVVRNAAKQAERMVGVNIDITERKQTETLMFHAKQAAEAANRQKTNFLNVMSHELRTPLTVILGYLPLLKNTKQPLAPELITQIAEDMDISGQHLLRMINDLLDISKVEAGEMHLLLSEINSLSIVEEMMKKFDNQAKLAGVQLINDVAEFSFKVDELRLRQIFINLIGNALKFTSDGSIKISATQDENSVSFSVTDTGIGIEETELPLIFNTFRQVDNTSTRSVGGSGLGLAITKRLVELHQGRIEVTSSVGVGTSFTFTIKQ